MKNVVFALCPLLALAGSMSAQQPVPSLSPRQAAEPSDRTAIEGLFKQYVDAYGSRNIDQLVALWPDLPNQKKEYNRIKRDFADTTISREELTMRDCETEAVKDSALAKCERTEQYVKTYSETEWFGDAMRADPGQRPTPWHVDNKRTVKKAETVWVRLRKNGEAWKIVSISDKPQSL